MDFHSFAASVLAALIVCGSILGVLKLLNHFY